MFALSERAKLILVFTIYFSVSCCDFNCHSNPNKSTKRCWFFWVFLPVSHLQTLSKTAKLVCVHSLLMLRIGFFPFTNFWEANILCTTPAWQFAFLNICKFLNKQGTFRSTYFEWVSSVFHAFYSFQIIFWDARHDPWTSRAFQMLVGKFYRICVAWFVLELTPSILLA